MLPPFTGPEKALIITGAAIFLYLLAMALGRTLKRRSGVRLGAVYQLFCIALALFVPLMVLNVNVVHGHFNLLRDLGAAVALLGTFFLIALKHRYVWELYFEKQRQMEVPQFLRQVAALVLFIVAVLLVLNIAYGHTIPGLLAGSGILAIILGLAMQDLLGNIISGISLHVGKPFKNGDWLKIDDQFAEVMEMNWRSTRLRTNDHVFLDIPNGQLAKNRISNLNYATAQYAMRLRVGIDYKWPPNRVKQVLQHAAASAQGVLATPPPKVFLVDFGEWSVTYEIKFWMENHALYNTACDSIRTHIWYELHRNKMMIPLPIRVLHIAPRQRAAEAPSVPEPIKNILQQNPFFHCMSPEEIERLLAAARLLEFGGDERIIEQGEQGDSMFVLVRGSAQVQVECDGVRQRVADLYAGDCFGEMSLLTGETRSATVVASCDCDVLEVDKATFAGLVENNEELLHRFSELLARRRIENEGVRAASKEALSEKEREYTASFLAKLYKFFEL